MSNTLKSSKSNSTDLAILSYKFFFLMIPPPPLYTLFPYTTLFRSGPAKSPSRCIVDKSCTRCRLDLVRSEEHTSELQSRENLVCRLLLEKKKKKKRKSKNNALKSDKEPTNRLFIVQLNTSCKLA